MLSHQQAPVHVLAAVIEVTHTFQLVTQKKGQLMLVRGIDAPVVSSDISMSRRILNLVPTWRYWMGNWFWKSY